jgi:uncharacterized protein YndB with AHSA1/START domain
MAKTVFKVDEDELTVTLSRLFNSTREKLWRAQTDRDSVARWWGPNEMNMTIDQFEPRKGGKWRICHTSPDGTQHWFNGEYKEIVKPEKIVRTFVYEPFPGAELVETSILEELPDGKTRLTTSTQFPALIALQFMVASDMERGATESLDRLAAIVEK